MRHQLRILSVLLAAAALLQLPACNSTQLDDGDSADVVLETGTITIPPIQGQIDQLTGVCTFTVTDATAQLFNKPKNEFAVTSPFNDIRNLYLQVAYTWDDALVAPTPDRVILLPGTVPANGSFTTQFSAILLGDLTPDKEGHTANLYMRFHGETVDGTPVSALGLGRTLSIGSCQ
ncbi:MAG TPA: hypothetical protein VF139_09405 [Candidatus Polarisedimenticolaceae bacterium]